MKLDQTSSVFYNFLTAVLDALGIQLELSTEREFGAFTEEILYYLKAIMPFRPDKSVFCITQLLKCLFSTNMLNQYQDFMNIKYDNQLNKKKGCFYKDVLCINGLKYGTSVDATTKSSDGSSKQSVDTKNPWMAKERSFLMTLENFHKSKMDRKWSTNKRELERYIRLFEPVVIQALKVSILTMF